MKAYMSGRSGVCAIQIEEAWHFIDVINSRPIKESDAHLVCGSIDDWISVAVDTQAELFRKVETENSIIRAVSNLEVGLGSTRETLQKDLLLDTEDLLKVDAIINCVMARLLCAPIKPDVGTKLQRMIELSLSEGLGATAHLLEHVRDSQPLIVRLVSNWLLLDEPLFVPIEGGRRSIWTRAVFEGVVLSSLAESTIEAFEAAWKQLAFKYNTPHERIAAINVASALASKQFPDQQRRILRENAAPALVQDHQKMRGDRDSDWRKPVLGSIALDQVRKQIDAIIGAVSRGDNTRGFEYLKDLIDRQLLGEGGEEYAVKSLCNIAQQSRELFRTDFERECLLWAQKIKGDDSWTLLQLADHFKRVGQYDEAMAAINSAQTYGAGHAATRMLADVYVQMRDFDRALHLYNSIEEDSDPEFVRGAKADIYRKMGRLDLARVGYEELIAAGLESDRVYAGLAEVAKRENRLDEAAKYYREILNAPLADAASASIYRMALANVLVRKNDLPEAYAVLDRVVQDHPFSMQARAFRAAVGGLLGKAREAILDLPKMQRTQAFDEWVNAYVQGLLLLMLNRYEDARKSLLAKVEQKFLDRESDIALRLGAAVFFLRKRAGLASALSQLTEMPEISDEFTNAIRVGLQFHIAVGLGRRKEYESLERQLSKSRDGDLIELVAAVKRRDWPRACDMEVRLLLRLVA